MTDTDKAGATTHVAPALPDLPPPLDEGEEKFDSANMGPVKQLWDVTAVYGPISRADLHKHRPVTSWNYREYVRFHPEVKGDTSMSTMMKADRWVWDRAIDLSLEQGWLTTDDKGRFVIATIPPDHKPLATTSEMQILAELDGDNAAAAMKILIAKINHARMKPQTVQKNALRKDLQERGQLQPIKVWKPAPMVHEHEIIVDGVTRAALLEELGIEPWKVYLPEQTSATEVLLQRISHELHPTTKDTTKEARDAYIAQLSELGFDHTKIAKQVGLSRNRVTEVLSAMSEYRPRTQPSPEDIAYMALLRDAGWTQRDISDRMQWSQKTVSKYLAIESEKDKIAESADPDTGTGDAGADLDALPREGSDAWVLLCTLMFDVPDSKGTRREIYSTAGMDPASGGGSFTGLGRGTGKAVGRFLIAANGKRGSSQVWEPTPKAWALISERPATLPAPVALPEPKPRGRKASTPTPTPTPRRSKTVLTAVPSDPDAPDVRTVAIAALEKVMEDTGADWEMVGAAYQFLDSSPLDMETLARIHTILIDCGWAWKGLVEKRSAS